LIAVDTNILVYAHREESAFHEKAFASLKLLADGDDFWAIPWPCIHEFISTVTNLRVYKPSSSVRLALDQIEELMQSPTLRIIGESAGYWPVLKKIVDQGQIVGGKVHDARIAAICVHHGVTELWTSDRDFSRIPAIRTRNPVI
jgi:toxin-antitoxin system PIN domain toxin